MTKDSPLTKELALYEHHDDTWDVPELEDSVYNPHNDEFTRTLRLLEVQVRQLTHRMRPKHAMMVKININEQNFTKTALRLKSTPQTVSTVWNSRDGIKLRQLLSHHHQLIQGVSALQREQLLWRIALNNEEFNPRTSVAALAEMNKMSDDTASFKAKLESEKDITHQPTIIIQLADPRLLPSPLDVN